jgi:sialate O-acetylesterase
MLHLRRLHRFTLHRLTLLCALILCSVGCATPSFLKRTPPAPATSLDPLFSARAVLQREMELPIWGKDHPGARITVEVAGQSAQTTADASGNWMLKLPPLPAGGPHTLTARGSGVVSVSDVLIGEVWVASGQSNMWWALKETFNAREVADQANFPNIRFLTVPQVNSLTAVDELTTATWQVCTPDVAYEFSSVGFYFARELNQRLNIPVGIICAAWPGTRLEAWLPAQTYKDDKRLHKAMQAFQDGVKDLDAEKAKSQQAFDQWLKDNVRVDPGNTGEARGWAEPAYDDRKWRKMDEPLVWDFYDMWFDGSIWFRRKVTLPDAWAGQPLRLWLGRIDDNDVTYFNGKRVGATEGNYIDRVYDVPAGLARPGENTVAVRVFDTFHWGGFYGPAFDVVLADGKTTPTISLRGPWSFQVEHAFPPVLKPQPGWPIEPWSAQAPACLFNGMINPLIPYGIRGALWYQGESNAGYPDAYYPLLPLLIRAWRGAWDQAGPAGAAGQREFPFYYVQLAPFEPGPPIDTPRWARLREAQTRTLELEPNTAMAVIVDHGDPYDIHPRAKQPVGVRLALAALARDYGQDVAYQGPFYERQELLGDAIRIHFAHAEGLHTSGTQRLKGFMLAGADRRFHPAQARIEGESVVVNSREVPTPLAVRYGWENAPDLNLFNAAGLPANPFRTDDWNNATRQIPEFVANPEIGKLPYVGQ